MNMNKLLLTTLAAILIFTGSAYSADWTIVPRGGLSNPAGKTGETWQSGYNIELDAIRSWKENHRIALRLGFHRWKPDAQELLSVNGRDFEVEQSRGWHAIGEVSGLVYYHLLKPRLGVD